MFFHGVSYVAEMDPSKQTPLRILKDSRVIASSAKKEWKPWRVETGDVDGDGKPELAIGITKSTRYIKQRHTTIFFYSFNGERLTKKWTGSTFGRPLIDFCMAPDRRTVATLQRTLQGKVALDFYRWSGFGFERTGGEKIWETATSVNRYKGKIAVVANGRRVLVDAGGLQ